MTHDQLRNIYNPDGSPLRAHQLRLLSMLKKIDAYCKQHNIRYTLSSGTVLGAVRHKGFVPWDDDIDIELTASQFRKFRNLIKKHPIEGLQWQDWKNDPAYVQPFAKLRDAAHHVHEEDSFDHLYKYHGPYIDIFILYPSNSLRLALLATHVQNLLQYRPQALPDTPRKIILPIAKALTHGAIYPFLRFISAIGAGKTLRHTPGTAYLKPRHRDDIFHTSNALFEDAILPIPANPHRYLTQIYGDYSRLPDADSLPKHLDTKKL
ncbi:MAG: LicD family protein [Bacteroidales bacterium]|nr:LicD family protein [Bacteroidales bacterium]